ncbi:MAG: TonB family protein [Paracoccaceae bacterium]
MREAARYGDVVMRQIARSPRRKAPDRGVVTVGFEIAPDGGLLQVAIVGSSGSAALDQMAVDHIRRAAPFRRHPKGRERGSASSSRANERLTSTLTHDRRAWLAAVSRVPS